MSAPDDWLRFPVSEHLLRSSQVKLRREDARYDHAAHGRAAKWSREPAAGYVGEWKVQTWLSGEKVEFRCDQALDGGPDLILSSGLKLDVKTKADVRPFKASWHILVPLDQSLDRDGYVFCGYVMTTPPSLYIFGVASAGKIRPYLLQCGSRLNGGSPTQLERDGYDVPLYCLTPPAKFISLLSLMASSST